MTDYLPFIDIHTHRTTDQSQSVSIKSVFLHNHHEIDILNYYSIGLHPWHIEYAPKIPEVEETLNILLEKNKNIIAIGEIGLDRLKSIDFETQCQYFKAQLLFAKKSGKPVIIHCVRAYDELIGLKKKLNLNVPLIIHGYWSNIHTTEQLLKHGFYMSLGEKSLEKFSKSDMQMIPLNKLFLETDESQTDISAIYEKASNIFNIPICELQDKIYRNFTDVFKIIPAVKKQLIIN